VQSKKRDLRTDAAECVLFFLLLLFAWTELAIVFLLVFGIRPTLRGYVLVVGCFSICWSLGYLPFRSIWEKLRGKTRTLHVDSPHAPTEDSTASMVATEVPNESQTESETITELLVPEPREHVYESL
jgi:hypothetical protein